MNDAATSASEGSPGPTAEPASDADDTATGTEATGDEAAADATDDTEAEDGLQPPGLIDRLRAGWRELSSWASANGPVVVIIGLVVGWLLVFGVPRRLLDSDPGPPPGAVPSYEAIIRDEHTIDVLTDATDPEGLRLIFDEVRDDHVDGDWWDVELRCASVPEGAGESLLATGRFANTVRGEEATGLQGGDHVTFDATGLSGCTPATPTVPGTLSAQDVFDRVEAAGLRVISPRDGSSACAELGCLERTVTDQFTVIVWPDTAAADRWATLVTIDAWRLGPATTAQINDAGFDPESGEREEYEAALGQAAADTDTTATTLAAEPGA